MVSRRPLRGLLTMRVFYSAILEPHPEERPSSAASRRMVTGCFPSLTQVPTPSARQRCAGRGRREQSIMSHVLTRAAIVAEARDWIGTRYRHQASLKGVGCDCLGLVRGVWRACVGDEP